MNYKVAFGTEKRSVKDTSSIASEKSHVTHKKPMAMYYDVQARSTKAVPLAMPSSQGLLVAHVRPLGKGRGP